MIDRIDHIKQFGIFQDFRWENDTPNYKSKNIFYGWNYSGKTTLSRIFKSLQDKEVFGGYAKKGEFTITADSTTYNTKNLSSFPFEILVFNSDYVKENLRWEEDDNINAIFFDVGEDAKNAKKIEELNQRIIQIEGKESVKGKKAPYLEKIQEFQNFDQWMFTEQSRWIKNQVLNSLIEFNKGHFKRYLNIVSKDIDRYILSKTSISKLNEMVRISSPKKPVGTISYEFQINEIIEEANALLERQPNEEYIIKILERNIDAFNWAKKGLYLHQDREKCLFCDNPIDKDRVELLNSLYQAEVSKLREEGEPLLKRIYAEKEKITQLNFPKSSQDLNDGFQKKYECLKEDIDKRIESYKRKLTTIEKRLSEKINHRTYQKVPTISLFNLDKLEEQFALINNILSDNDEFSEEFETKITEARQEYLEHLVAIYLKENKYLAKERKAERATAAIEKLDKKIAEYKKEIDRLEALRNSSSEGGIQLQYFINSFLAKDDIKVQYNEESQKYNLVRGEHIARHLSEGEKMAISFSHFFVTLKSLKEQDKLKDTIVFIDDPISSLDSNHIFQINALLKDFFYKKVPQKNNPNQQQWEQGCLQLFISTHNYEFFNLLKAMPTEKGFRYSKGWEKRYFIERSIDHSSIIQLPVVYDNFQSEYHFLFKEIYTFNENSDKQNYEKLLLMPNVLRRFLEIYTLAKYPSGEGGVDERANEVFGGRVSKRICKPFHYFSHFNNIDRIGKHSEFLSDISNACNSLMEHLEKDEKHYKGLKTVL